MRRYSIMLLTAFLVASPSVYADDHDHPREPVSPADPAIKITINPEARVSVVLAGALPPPAPCGTAVDILVKVVNQGFVTSRLEAELVGAKSAGTTLDFHPEALRGIPEEQRDLRITLMKPGPTDLTVSFRTHNNAPDLGGRDRIHFLMKCVPRNLDQGGFGQFR